LESSIAIIFGLLHSAQWVALKATKQSADAAHFPGSGIIQSPLRGVILKPVEQVLHLKLFGSIAAQLGGRLQPTASKFYEALLHFKHPVPEELYTSQFGR